MSLSHLDWADMEDSDETSDGVDTELDSVNKVEITLFNNIKISVKSIDELINQVNNNSNKIYNYVTGRIHTPFNQFSKMIRVDYHYHKRMIKIYRIYNVLDKEKFKNVYTRIIEDFTEELFKNCFIYLDKLYIPFLYCKEDEKYYDMLKYIKPEKQYELVFYTIPF